MADFVCYCVGCGLGNQIQTIPVYQELVKKHETVHVLYLGLGAKDPRKEYTPVLFPNVIPFEEAQKSMVARVYTSAFGSLPNHGPKVPWTTNESGEKNRSEIEQNFMMAGIDLPELPYAWDYELPVYAEWIEENNQVVIAPDVGIEPATGLRPDKGYGHWAVLIARLLSMGIQPTIVGDMNGLPADYPWRDCKDRTDLDLIETLALVDQADIFMGNDSGLYHTSNMLNTRNFALFREPTHMLKNYDARFYPLCTALDRPSPAVAADMVRDALNNEGAQSTAVNSN